MTESKKEFEPKNYTIKYVLLGLALVVMLVVAIIINENHKITGSDMVAGTVNVDNGDLKINWDRYDTYDIELSETLTITKSGVYHLTGSLKDQNIIVNVADGKVKLILDNVTIKNSTGPAIACLEADDLVIELIGENTLEDGKTYAKDYDDDVSGVIYSKSDLTFEGDGTINLTASYQDGIVGKDDLKFNSGTYIITAADDGIRGKDSIYIVDGDFVIAAKADAIKSTNETTAGKGFVLIEKGKFDITAGAKGIKAVNSILIYDGALNITSTDDAIHTNNYIGIIGGEITISSGDDGIHADKELIIEDGTITIEKSYEGLEAQAITISGGKISIKSSDDGMNAGGGADASAKNRPGAGAFDANTNCALTFNGGETYINASGDGVDSNGYIYFNGGTVVVDGPTNNGNGALDSGVSITQTGGTVIAVGSSGMAETLGSNSTVNNISVYFTNSNKAGTKITIKNSSGETIMTHTSAKAFNHMSVGIEAFKQGETYTIYLDDTKYQSFTISGTTTTIGNNNMNPSNMGPDNMNQQGKPPMQAR